MDSRSSISFLNEPVEHFLIISLPFLSSLLGGFAVALLLHPPKSDDKNGQEMFKKCSTDQRFIREKKYYLQNPYFQKGTLTTVNTKKLMILTG